MSSRLTFESLSGKYPSIKKNVNENELSYFFSLRVSPGIPLQIKNLLPVLFNMKLENFFLATLFGDAPSIIIMISIISGFAGAIEAGKNLDLNLIFSPEIFFPLLALAGMSLVANLIKKKYFKKLK